MRNLGTQRSLILVDGMRMPDTTPTGGVDANILPQELVSHVDVVTGGASAVYGSQAVVGVVNFVLDHNFEGVKFNASTGISWYMDDPSSRFTAAYGTTFDNGRGHIELSADHYYIAGVHDIANRPNGKRGLDYVGSSTVKSPRTVYPNVGFTYASAGGTITQPGPLHFYQFQPDGTIKPEDMGPVPTINPTNYCFNCSGGRFYHNWLTSKLRTDRFFVRGSYDLTSNISAHVMAFAAEAVDVVGIQQDAHFGHGTPTNITIYNDNPYLNPSVLAMMNANNMTSFDMGRLAPEAPLYTQHSLTRSAVFNFGLDGDIGTWHWDVNYLYGNAFSDAHDNEFNQQKYYAAVDAVRDPATGDIVCGVTLRNPGLMPGCVPMNVMGAGSMTPAAIKYISWNTHFSSKNTENIIGGNLTGPLFELPAGPVSLAVGLEYRDQAMVEKSNTDPAKAASVDYTGIRGVPNNVGISSFTAIGAARGALSVEEAYGEVDVPLVKDVPMVQNLSLNGAIRMTNYSTSGTVYTWKIGADYSPIEDLRFRGTLSRDIAAPTLFQLFAGTQIAQVFPVDIHTGWQGQVSVITKGNPDLKPERGTMIVGGAVWSPSWFPGFTQSVDYYNLRINDAIASPNNNTLQLLCEQSNGTSPFCANIIRPFPFSNTSVANHMTEVIAEPINQGSIVQAGIDFQTVYQFALSDLFSGASGTVGLNAYASLVVQDKNQLATGYPYVSALGWGRSQPLTALFQESYGVGNWSFQLGERFVSNTKNGSQNRPVHANYRNEPAVWYFNANISYKLDDASFMQWLGDDSVGKEIFFHANNLFNRTSPVVPDCCNAGEQYPTDYHKYNPVGGYYTIGIRLRY